MNIKRLPSWHGSNMLVSYQQPNFVVAFSNECYVTPPNTLIRIVRFIAEIRDISSSLLFPLSSTLLSLSLKISWFSCCSSCCCCSSCPSMLSCLLVVQSRCLSSLCRSVVVITPVLAIIFTSRCVARCTTWTLGPFHYPINLESCAIHPFTGLS